MKKIFFLLIIISMTSCQVTETIHLNADGSGKIEVVQLRDEQSYMQLAGENYSKEEEFADTTYVFKDFITKYSETFSKLTKEEKEVFQKFNAVNVHVKKSSYEKEFRTTITQNFNAIGEVPDLYKTMEYTDDLEHNYALSAEEHYYKVSYVYEGSVFKRIVKVSDSIELKKQQEKIKGLNSQLSKIKLNQSYALNYYFPRKIQSISNPSAKISEDRKSFLLEFLLSDCLQDPESTSLEVVLE